MTSWSDRLAVVDLETTGTDPSESRIVTAFVGMLDADGRVSLGRTWVADPGVEIPEGAAEVHGYSTERARSEGRAAEDVIAEIVAELRTHVDQAIPLVAYNAAFDLTLLHREAVRHGIEPLGDVRPVVDPLVLDRALDPDADRTRTLTAVAEHYRVPFDDPHNAGADAIAAGRVAQALARRHPDALAVTAGALHDRQRVWYAEQAAAWAAGLLAEKGRVSTESDAWPLALDGAGRHRAAPLRIAAAVIARTDGALLFVRKRGTTALMQPGGKLEPGEAASTALVRELEEELGLRLRPAQLTPMGRYEAPAANEAGVVVDAQVFDAPLTAQPEIAAEIEEFAWIHPDDAGALTARDIAPLSRDILIPLVRGRRDRSRAASGVRPQFLEPKFL